ncbi:M23 family metallopeptidase [Curtobacterium sp. MCBA15_008]|uniref:M23 family metallopeptidase n=1 Tax=Curtobacterium sp. MCBA15_008 TaxID=1898736 RepID=UPI000AA3BB48|nr:M23 family metallopeptidase [Curtobacterium sp. MCBA15_008]
MTTPREIDQHPGTPVVHLSRRAALEAERAAARKPERSARKAERSATKADRPKPTPKPKPERTGRRATIARATTEHGLRNTPDARIQRVVRRPAATVTSLPAAPRASRQQRASRPQRATRITLTSALAALAMFAASAMPAHASAGTSMATSTLAPTVRTQDYAVTQAISASALDRDEFTVGGGTASSSAAPGTAVSYGGAVRSPFPGPVRMSSGFGYRSAPCGACSSLHQGLDFNPGMGAPIGAVAAGTVRVSGTYFSYGNAVIIDHVVDGREVSTLYGHMIPGSSPLKVGDTVEAGEFIGKVGSSGVSTGAHLHLEVLMDGVTPIDPKAWLEARIGRTLTA